MPFFKGSESLLNFKTGVGLSFNLIMSVPDPLLGHINLLSELHDNSRVIKHMHMNEYESLY